MLVGIVDWQTTGAASTMSASVAGQTPTGATLVAGSLASYGSPTNKRQIFYYPNLTAGGTRIVTVSFTVSSYAVAGIMEYQGQDAAMVAEDGTNTGNSSNTQPSISLTTATDNALIVASCSAASVDPTAGAGYLIWGGRTNNQNFEEDEDNVDAGAAGSKTVSFVTSDPTGTWYVIAASFKPAGGGGTTPLTFGGTDSLAGGELL
jgi:hypothetical protein